MILNAMRIALLTWETSLNKKVSRSNAAIVCLRKRRFPDPNVASSNFFYFLDKRDKEKSEGRTKATRIKYQSLTSFYCFHDLSSVFTDCKRIDWATTTHTHQEKKKNEKMNKWLNSLNFLSLFFSLLANKKKTCILCYLIRFYMCFSSTKIRESSRQKVYKTITE